MIARALVATIATNQARRSAPRPGGRRRRAPIVALAVLVAVVVPAAARADAPRIADRPAYVPGELIVKFKPGVSAAERADAVGDRDARLTRSLELPRTALARVPAGDDVRRTARALERDPRVAYAQPNPYRYGAAVPNDEFFDRQWALANTGQTLLGTTGVSGADIDAPGAWELTTGSPDVKVAVVDSGVNLDHPDLAPNIWHNPGESGGGRESNGVDDDGNGFVDDWRGWDFIQGDNEPADNFAHGTHVAGAIAARGNDGVGVSGVAWRASIVPVRVLDNANVGDCGDIADGMAYAVRAGARVVNVSIGSYAFCQAEQDVVDSAPQTLFVVAAMNDAEDVDATPVYPCSLPSPNVVCVAATDPRDQLAGFSNYGATSVDLAAPGVNVLSAWLKWGPADTLYTDGFEDGPIGGSWVTGGAPDSWIRTPFVATQSGSWALSNSTLGSYSNNTNNWAELVDGLDLRGQRNCAANVWANVSLGDEGQPLYDRDRLMVEESRDGVHYGRRPDGRAGNSGGFFRWAIDLSELEGRANGSLRFHLIANASGTSGGVVLDDLEVVCAPPLTEYTGEPDEFAFDSGTSFATPQVSGVAVLLLSLDPRMTVAEMRRRILSTVDPLPSLAGITATGGRLNAARALAARPADPPPAGSPAGREPSPSPSPRAVASLVAGQARAVAKALRTVGMRAILRRRGFGPANLYAPGPGRLTLQLVGPRGVTIAAGACSAGQAGYCPVTAKLTRRGRTLLRRARRALLPRSRRTRITLVLAFEPRSGRAIVRRTAVTIGRFPTKSRHGGSR
jgi:subtilisin family serine protease